MLKKILNKMSKKNTDMFAETAKKKEKKRLEECEVKSINYLTMEGVKCYAKCISCYDGDSIKVIAPFPETDKIFKFTCRLLGINTAELRTKDVEEKKMGYKARDFLREKILNQIIWAEFGKPDKYGRNLLIIYDDEKKKINFNQLMIDEGMAMEYDGKGKKSWK